MILKSILKKKRGVKVWSGLIWFRIRPVAGSLELRGLSGPDFRFTMFWGDKPGLTSFIHRYLEIDIRLSRTFSASISFPCAYVRSMYSRTTRFVHAVVIPSSPSVMLKSTLRKLRLRPLKILLPMPQQNSPEIAPSAVHPKMKSSCATQDFRNKFQGK
jgi:hypothetical protein